MRRNLVTPALIALLVLCLTACAGAVQKAPRPVARQVFVLQSGGDPVFVIGCLGKTGAVMSLIFSRLVVEIIKDIACEDEQALADRVPWTRGLATQFSNQFSSALRGSGVRVDLDAPSVGLRKDKYGLTPAYPANNAPYDTLVDFAVRAAAFLPADRVRGERQYIPVVVVLMRVIDGTSGRPRSQRFLIFGPSKITYPEYAIVIESDTGQFNTTLTALQRDPDAARRVLHEATARLAIAAAQTLKPSAP
jgi:hypothetical protein